jgi:hypothetical protein
MQCALGGTLSQTSRREAAPEIWIRSVMEFPGPDDVPTLFLQAIGAPLVVVTLVAFALFVTSWVQFGVSAARHGSAAARSVATFVEQRTTRQKRRQVVFVLLAVPFTILVVAGARLGPLYLGKPPSNPVWEDWAWIEILSTWDSEAGWYLLATGVSVFLLGLSQIARLTFLKVLLAVAWTPVLLAGALVGIIWVVAFAGNALMWGLTSLSGDSVDEYTFATAAGFFILGLTHWGPPYLGTLLWGLSSEAFSPDHDGANEFA